MKDAAFKGRCGHVLPPLLSAGDPCTSLNIAHQVIVLRGLKGNPATVIIVGKRMGAALWKLKTRRVVEKVPQAGEYKMWILT